VPVNVPIRLDVTDEAALVGERELLPKCARFRPNSVDCDAPIAEGIAYFARRTAGSAVAG
jgi:hypothetical protein